MSGGRFVKGQSGNPAGRPKGREALLRAEVNAYRKPGGEDVPGEVALIRRMMEIALGDDAKDAVAAFKVLAPYVFGNPRLAVEVSGREITPEEEAILTAFRMTPHERRKRLAELGDDEPTDGGIH